MTDLKLKREECGFTQHEVASILHINERTVRRWEKHESRPSLDYIFKLCKLYDIDVYDYDQ